MNKLERTFLNILKEYGHDVLLLHSNRQTRCSCYEDLTGSVDRDCPICFGMGHTITSIKRVTTRKQDLRQTHSLPFIASGQDFGEMAVETRAYFFYKDIVLSERDLIVEVNWNGDMPVYAKDGIYEISHIDPLQYKQGEVVYNKVYVKDRPISKELRGFKIVKRAGEIRYQLKQEREG